MAGYPIIRTGSGGGNVTFTSETEPVTPNDGDSWFQPSTQLFKVYESGAFVPIKVDFADLAFNINDGYF